MRMPPPAGTVRAMRRALVLLLCLTIAACASADPVEPEPCLDAPPIDLDAVDTSVPAYERDPVQIPDPRFVYTCEDFPGNPLGLGLFCATNADCTRPDSFCATGILPCGAGVCTKSCRMDSECHDAVIDFDTPPPLVCTVASEDLSVCLPSQCLPRIEGWDTTCGPLSGEPVNDYGIGLRCHGDEDCAGQEASVCPGGGNGPEPHCTMNCETDVDCGPNAVCTCVDNPECTEQFFVCAPIDGCADAVRHHHCRGYLVPPRDHEFACGDHDH